MTEPIPVIPLEYAKPDAVERGHRVWRQINRGALIAGASVTLIGWVMILIDAKSVLVSGPLLMLIGLAMLVGGFRRRQALIWTIGAAHCAVCVLFIALVNLLHWGPRPAQTPFAIMGAAYNLLTIPAALWAWVRRVG